MEKKTVMVFGATGAIGSSICNWFEKNDYLVIEVSRKRISLNNNPNRITMNWDFESNSNPPLILKKKLINAVVWAQGSNLNDDIYDFELARHESIYKANVSYILLSLNLLLKNNLLAESSRLCVISSIWQNIAKQNKLSYCVTKSALQGLVQSISIDLGSEGHLINAVLPGATDTPMTRENLRSDQIEILEKATPLGSLPNLDDVCNLVGFLCSQSNTGITGQFVAADRGFSYARII